MCCSGYGGHMLILGILGFGVLIGGLAQLIVGRAGPRVDWGMAIVAGRVGSFLGGLIISLIAGDGIKLRASGIIGSLAGAIIITLVWQGTRQRAAASARAAEKKAARSGRHR